MGTRPADTSPSPEVFGLTKIWEIGAKVSYLGRGGLALQLVAQALASIRHSPLVSVVSVVTIGIALFILTSFLVALGTADQLLGGVRSDLSLTVFLDDRSPPEQVARIQEELKALSEVNSVEFRDKAAALVEFRRSLGADAGLLDGLDQENPLPASIEVQLKPEFNSVEAYERVANLHRDHPAVERITYSSEMLGQLAGLIALLRRGGILVVLGLLVVTGMIVAMTISLALYSRREEIYIMRLVGAAPKYVAAPSMIEGALLGAAGALIALFAAYGMCGLVEGFMREADVLRQFVPEIRFIGWGWSLLVLFTGVIVGVGGSALAVRQFAREIE